MQTQKQQAPEQLHDCGGIQRRQRQKFPVGRKGAIGDKPATVRVEVRDVSTISPKRQDA
jgi:hypothetical protein